MTRFSAVLFALLLALPLLTCGGRLPAQNCLDFTRARHDGKAVTTWTCTGKPFTRGAQFSLVDLNSCRILRLHSKNGAGALLCDLSKIDLKKYPWMRWQWRADILPKGANAEDPDKDDQAIGIYVGSGSAFAPNSVACRWETITPKDKSGFTTYGLGMVRVRWFAVRNVADGLKKRRVGECNIYEALTSIFAAPVPAAGIVLTLSANSQCTGSSSDAYLDYLELDSRTLNSAEPRYKDA